MLRVILACKQMNQKDVAEKSGLSKATVGRLYNEKWTQVDKSTMIKLCSTLNVGVGDLFVYVKK